MIDYETVFGVIACIVMSICAIKIGSVIGKDIRRHREEAKKKNDLPPEAE